MLTIKVVVELDKPRECCLLRSVHPSSEDITKHSKNNNQGPYLKKGIMTFPFNDFISELLRIISI